MTDTIPEPVRFASPLIEAEIQQNVYSSVEGEIGNWSLRTTARLAAIPPVGTSFVFSYGGDSQITETVKHVFFHDGGRVLVDLRSIVTDSPAVLRELATRLQHGWEVLGGPWEAQ